MAKPVELRPATFVQKDWPLRAEVKSKSSVFSDRPKTETVLSHAESGKNIAAIDFGTTHCSLAYTTETNDSTVSLKLNEIFARVPTAILLVKEGEEIVGGEKFGVRCKVHAFGRDAQTQYQRIRADDRSKYIYFEKMKMFLQHDKVCRLSLCHDNNC